MIEITTRLRRLYVQDGTNYVQEAADTIDKLRAERDALVNEMTDDLTPAELRAGVALQLREIERLRLRVKALESAITESLRIAGNWPEGAQAVLKDALPTLGEYAAQKDSK